MKLTNHEWLQAARRTLLYAMAVVLAGLLLGPAASAATVSTTTVQGTVYLADGSVATGTLILSWPSFTTSSGQLVTADSTTVTIAADGFVSVSLAPNLGATPAGLYYTAVYYLSDGTTSTGYWVVPVAAQVTLASVQAQLMPATQAVQTVSKAYVDQAITELTESLLTASGGTLSGDLYLNGDPTTPLQAADKRYVDKGFSLALPLTGGTLTGPLTAVQLGAVYQADQFYGADFGSKVSACVSALSATYGGTCDARNFSGSQTLSANLTISTANATVLLPCATISTSNQIIVTAGTRNVTLRGCALRGASTASGSQGGTVFLYSGAGALLQVGDPTYATNTMGFHLDNAVINTTAASSSAAQGLVAYRTQEMDLESLYFLGNANQTGITLDGTGNYTGGTYIDDEFSGYQTAVNAIGHQTTNTATTDWVNASTFVRLHIDCPTSNGSPVSGSYGINLQQGDGNTFTGGDVEGCDTIMHLGANAQNNTIIGLRNENSNNQVVADAGSSYNSWITGGTMFTGQLTDNGTRNSFLDTFHRSFNGMNGDWYGSQKDATVTNHYRVGIGTGNERGLLDRYQTDSGYRWTTGLSDATAGEQFYEVLDELNNVYRLSIGQYNNGQSSTNNQTVINSAGSGAVVLNGSNNAGTGGVVVGSGGSSETTVATISNAGNAQFNGTLQVGGATTLTSSAMVKNQADAEIDATLWAGATTSQKESYIYKDWNGNSQWFMVKDASNNWALNSATGGLDSFKAYQSTNSGDTYVNASNSSGTVRVNYESGSGAGFNVYGGNSSSLYASFTGTTAIKFPGLAATSGHSCLQIDNSGYITNTGATCGTGNTNGTVGVGTDGQIAYYSGNGSAIAGTSTVSVKSGGTGASAAAGALANLGGVSLTQTATQTLAGELNLPNLEGALYADQQQSPATTGNNGIGLSVAQCASMAYECSIVAPALYAMTEGQPFGGSPLSSTSLITSGPKSSQPTASFLDLRYGVPQWIFNQSQPVGNRFMAQPTFAMNNITGPGAGLSAHYANALALQSMAFANGRNFYNDKANFSTLQLQSYKYTQAQGGGDIDQNVYCLGNGDCVGHTIDTIAYGGASTASDEGDESMRFEAIEGGQVFGATLASLTAASDGSTTLSTASQKYNGYQGEGRLLIDLTQKYNGGYISSILSSGGNEIVSCTGCSWDTTYGKSTQTKLTAAVANSGSANSFPQSNAVLPVASSSGFTVGKLACIFDFDYECERITAIGTGTVTIATDRLPHPAGAYVTTNGLAGYSIEFEADRVIPGSTNGVSTMPDSGLVSTIRSAIPIMYNVSGNQLAIFQGGNSLPGNNSGYTGRAYDSMGSGGSVSLTISSGVLTGCTVSGGNGYSINNPPQITISGSWTSAPSAHISSTSSGTLSGCAVSSGGTGISSATASVAPFNPYDIYPTAKVTGVYNASTGAVDGTLYTEPLAGTFTVGDSIEEPHYFWQSIRGATNVVGSYIPSPTQAARTALSYDLDGVWQGSDTAVSMNNESSPTLYTNYPAGTPWIAGRGQVYAPTGFSLSGVYNRGLYMNTPPFGYSNAAGAALTIGCGSIGCASWTSPYFVLGVGGNGSNDGLSYNPSTRAWNFSGGSFSLSTSGGGNVPVVTGTPTKGHIVLWGGGTPATLIDGGLLSSSGASGSGGGVSITTMAGDAACFADTAGTLIDCGSALPTGTVSSFAVASWPSWLTASVSTATSTPTLAVATSPIPTSALASVAGAGAGLTTGPTSGTTVNDAACFADAAGTLTDCGAGVGTGTVTSFLAPAAGWPAWLMPSVATATSTPSLAVAVSSIPNSALANAATTVNGQSCALGGSCTVAATAESMAGVTLAANVVSSSLSSVGTITSGVWQGTPVANGYLANSTTTVNGQSCALGGSCTITPAAGTLTGSSLPSTITGSSLTGVGTITSGGWQGTAIAPAYISTGTSGANIPLLSGSNTWSGSTTTFANAAASADYVVIQPGASTNQIGALEFANYAGTSQWEIRKDASNTFRIRDTVNSLDRMVQYAGGQTVINSGGTAAVAVNNTSSSGTGGFLVYEGGTNYNTLAFGVGSNGNANLAGTFTANSLIDSSVLSAALLGTSATGSLISESMSGDATLAAGGVLTLATVNSTTGSFGSAMSIPTVTVNGKGQVTTVASNAVVAPAGTLTGAALASNVVTSSLTGVGTITTGVWQGTPVANSYLANAATTVNGQSCTLGSSCTVSAAPTPTGFTTLTDSSTVTLATGGAGVTNATLTLSHSTSTRALNVTGLASGASFTVVLKQDTTGGAVLSLGSGCTWYLGTNAGFSASTTPALTTAAGGINILSVLYDGSNCYANVR
jgi:hypothetical protein